MSDPQFRTPEGCAIRIWTDPVKNPFASEKLGRPIFDEAIYVEVIAPGSKGSTPVFEVERTYHESVGLPPARSPQYETYAAQIKAYKDNETVSGITGTPLAEWPEVSRSMAASLRASEIYTVEALAALADTHLNVVGPDGRTWRTKAQAWLDSTKDAGHATALAAALELANDRNARMEAQIAELSGQIAAMSAGKAPPKAAKASGAPPAPEAAPEAPTPPEITLAAAPAPEGDDVVLAPSSPGGLQPII